MRFVILTKFLLLFSFFAFAAGDEFTIYRVQYRTPEELIRVASGVLQGKASFSSMGEKIVISGSPSATKAALELFRELDRKPRLFRISMRRGGKSDASEKSVGFESDIAGKHVSIRKRSGIVRGGDPAVRAQVGGVGVVADASDSGSAGAESSSVQVLEGGEAQISSGNSWFPSGMWVRPRPAGKNAVQLELYSRKSKGVQMESASTTVQAPLGKWTNVGGVSKQSQSARGEILGSGSASSQSNSDWSILVEEVR